MVSCAQAGRPGNVHRIRWLSRALFQMRSLPFAALSGSSFSARRRVNEQLIADAGLELVKQDDVTENTAAIAGRWHAARADDEKRW